MVLVYGAIGFDARSCQCHFLWNRCDFVGCGTRLAMGSADDLQATLMVPKFEFDLEAY